MWSNGSFMDTLMRNLKHYGSRSDEYSHKQFLLAKSLHAAKDHDSVASRRLAALHNKLALANKELKVNWFILRLRLRLRLS